MTKILLKVHNLIKSKVFKKNGTKFRNKKIIIHSYIYNLIQKK